ncbi:hypothetical protein CLV92_108132 [Kineococcus xinjiangensis]|uniref:Tetratricopeptide repeat protein n=1 Tax=Kineococcus xinjiangensis TaxID=512762 RepID=A0A2S6IJ98_9ACTN|nr:hypothetical protein [Kineococcus xinjiangensis]PPK94230.1 hypothetical protein CLV92_108132 [Kineococcus xinjiangensis]
MTLDKRETMLVLRVPQELIEAELQLTRRRDALNPGGWSTVASAGKLLRYAGDRGGLDLLHRSAETYVRTMRGRSAHTLLTAANLFRLAGEEDRARELLLEVYRILRDDPEDAEDILVGVFLLLGRDDQAVAMGELAAADGEAHEDLVYPELAALARARASGNVAACEDVVGRLDRALASAAEGPGSTGGVNLHDWLELALVIHSELSGTISPRLHEM